MSLGGALVESDPMAGDRIPPEWRPLIDRAVEAYRAALGDDLVAIALFGSVARGQARPHSDLDLYVVTRERVSVLLDPRLDRVQDLHRSAEYAALRELGFRPDPAPVLHTVAELVTHPWILLDIADHGVILHDPEGVLGRELAAVRRRLVELGSRRVEQPDGSWYWELRPDWRPGDTIEL
jgi:predicted nucleotidyltransferase